MGVEEYKHCSKVLCMWKGMPRARRRKRSWRKR
jgi:hypothetical protein